MTALRLNASCQKLKTATLERRQTFGWVDKWSRQYTRNGE